MKNNIQKNPDRDCAVERIRKLSEKTVIHRIKRGFSRDDSALKPPVGLTQLALASCRKSVYQFQ